MNYSEETSRLFDEFLSRLVRRIRSEIHLPVSNVEDSFYRAGRHPKGIGEVTPEAALWPPAYGRNVVTAQ